jgi:hypothetical protein
MKLSIMWFGRTVLIIRRKLRLDTFTVHLEDRG